MTVTPTQKPMITPTPPISGTVGRSGLLRSFPTRVVPCRFRMSQGTNSSVANPEATAEARKMERSMNRGRQDDEPTYFYP